MQIDESSGTEGMPAEMGVLDRSLAALENAIVALAALFIAGLMFLGVVQIVVRAVWDLPIRGYIDYVELLMAFIAFGAVGYAERLRAHIRMDFLPASLSGGPQALFEAFLQVIALIGVSVLVYSTWFSFQRTWLLGDSTMDINAPIWPSKLLLFVALALLWLRIAISIAGYLMNWRRRSH